MKLVDNESCVLFCTCRYTCLSGTLRSNIIGHHSTDQLYQISGKSYNRPMKAKKNLIIVGDRVLLDPDERMDRTTSGLYLPPTVKEKEKVLGGYVIKTGPGYAIHDPASEESWTAGKKELKYIPLQASEGDYAIFLREAAIEIEFEGKKYLIVPHSAILALVRTEITGIEES
jgi:chaperonin GroES